MVVFFTTATIHASKEEYHPLDVATADMQMLMVGIYRDRDCIQSVMDSEGGCVKILACPPREDTVFACENLPEMIAAGVPAYLEEYIAGLQRLFISKAQRGF